jgi:electron transport complex protein RnfG
MTTAGVDSTANMKKIVKLGIVLFAVTAITGMILGVVNEITREPIMRTQARLREEALAMALPEADEFSDIQLAEGADPMVQGVEEGKKGGAHVGYCVSVASSGYGGPIGIVVGITENGGLRAIRILSQTETPGLGAKAALPAFFEQFSDKDGSKLSVVKGSAAAPDQIEAISGATITSEAVTLGVNTALAYWQDNLRGEN